MDGRALSGRRPDAHLPGDLLLRDHRRRAVHHRAPRPDRRRLRVLGARLQVRARGREAARRARDEIALTKLRAMPMYQRLGDVPRKRHIQFRDNGTLLTEEVMGLEGFSGNESILYHLQSPCRVRELGDFEPVEREEWVPEQHTHLHFKTFDTAPEGDEVTGRRVLMWNNDV